MSPKKFINYKKCFIMVSEEERNKIIKNIDNTKSNNLELTITQRKTTNFWKTKHYPKNEIPTNIYSLGSGNRYELYVKYKEKYEYIDFTEFTNYLRELHKQKIALIN